MKVLIDSTRDGNRDGNRGERWRTNDVPAIYRAIVGELWRTLALKTARVQALVGSNPTPSVFEFHPLAGVAPVS